MKTLVTTLLFAVLAVPCPADDAAAPPNQGTQSIPADFSFDGVWKPKGAMLSGVLLPPPALEAITLTIAGDRYEVTVIGEDHSDAGIFLLDETVTPHRMVIKSESGPNKGKIILAIYEIKGPNAMRACYDLSGAAFPTEFKAPKETQLYVAGYRRQVDVPQTEEESQ
ncbi:MAG: TIGR03067 domain-containing protein [Planctomycetaceae bacterium]|nr:TIGR03067 domain-containing protein [Planctomycetaceae bacterium]